MGSKLCGSKIVRVQLLSNCPGLISNFLLSKHIDLIILLLKQSNLTFVWYFLIIRQPRNYWANFATQIWKLFLFLSLPQYSCVVFRHCQPSYFSSSLFQLRFKPNKGKRNDHFLCVHIFCLSLRSLPKIESFFSINPNPDQICVFVSVFNPNLELKISLIVCKPKVLSVG